MEPLFPRVLSKYARPVNILFVGAGAVGCFYASRLHSPESNVFVSLVCRSNYEAIVRNGGSVAMQTRNFGDYAFTPSAVYPSIRAATEAGRTMANPATSPTGRRQQGWDYIFVTTKALPDVTDDARDIEPLVKLAPDGRTCIVLIQNGVGIEEPHRLRFPLNPIVTAVTIVNAEQISPGVVRQNRWTRISMGPYSDGVGAKSAAARTLADRGTAATRQLVTLFAEPGKLRDAEEHDEVGILLVRWHKICINAAMNPSAVLSGGLPSADMVLDAELRTHLRGVMEEVFDAAPVILGRSFPPNLASPERILRSTERNTGGRPSMLVDWQEGRPLELEVILGNPIRIARRHGVDMQRMQTMYSLLKSAQQVRDSIAAEKRRVALAESQPHVHIPQGTGFPASIPSTVRSAPETTATTATRRSEPARSPRQRSPVALPTVASSKAKPRPSPKVAGGKVEKMPRLMMSRETVDEPSTVFTEIDKLEVDLKNARKQGIDILKAYPTDKPAGPAINQKRPAPKPSKAVKRYPPDPVTDGTESISDAESDGEADGVRLGRDDGSTVSSKSPAESVATGIPASVGVDQDDGDTYEAVDRSSELVRPVVTGDLADEVESEPSGLDSLQAGFGDDSGKGGSGDAELATVSGEEEPATEADQSRLAISDDVSGADSHKPGDLKTDKVVFSDPGHAIEVADEQVRETARAKQTEVEEGQEADESLERQTLKSGDRTNLTSFGADSESESEDEFDRRSRPNHLLSKSDSARSGSNKPLSSLTDVGSETDDDILVAEAADPNNPRSEDSVGHGGVNAGSDHLDDSDDEGGSADVGILGSTKPGKADSRDVWTAERPTTREAEQEEAETGRVAGPHLLVDESKKGQDSRGGVGKDDRPLDGRDGGFVEVDEDKEEELAGRRGGDGEVVNTLDGGEAKRRRRVLVRSKL